MQDTDLYKQLLGVSHPWKVTKVELNSPAGRVDVWIKDRSGISWACPKCHAKASVYDHSQERVWRHLNTCQFGTDIHSRMPPSEMSQARRNPSLCSLD